MQSVNNLSPAVKKSASGIHRLTVCLISGREYGIPTEFIQEILLPPPKFQVDGPPPPPPLAGTTDLRGLRLATFHLCLLLDLPCTLSTSKQRTLVCRLLGFRIGLLVDAIGENLSIPDDFVQPTLWHTPLIAWVARLGQEERDLPILEMGFLTEHLQHLLINPQPQWLS